MLKTDSYNPKFVYVALALLVFCHSVTSLNVGSSRWLVALSLLILPLSYYATSCTNGDVFFFDKNARGKYNLLYIWIVLSGGLIIPASGVFNNYHFGRILFFLFLFWPLFFVLSGLTHKRFWNGLDTMLGLGMSTLLFCLALVVSLFDLKILE